MNGVRFRNTGGPGGVSGSPESTLDIQLITVNGRRYHVTTADLKEEGNGGIGANKRTAEMTGGGAVIATIVSEIVGNGKGTAIGAAVSAKSPIDGYALSHSDPS
jgi:hypothetical protein